MVFCNVIDTHRNELKETSELNHMHSDVLRGFKQSKS